MAENYVFVISVPFGRRVYLFKMREFLHRNPYTLATGVPFEMLAVAVAVVQG